ncbi:MAG: hypothetical protein RLZZ540_1474 [Bacteroidota bacterium]|jgi:uncharacterized membrane protein YagU involved in acid resistance
MIRNVLMLFVKSLIGALIVWGIIYSVLELSNYISVTYGEIYGFLCFIIVAIIIVVVCNKINKKRNLEFNEEEKTK